MLNLCWSDAKLTDGVIGCVLLQETSDSLRLDWIDVHREDIQKEVGLDPNRYSLLNAASMEIWFSIWSHCCVLILCDMCREPWEFEELELSDNDD